MSENWIMIAIGLALIIASGLAKGFSYGMPPHQQKPTLPATARLRYVLLCFGIVALVLGILRIINKA